MRCNHPVLEAILGIMMTTTLVSAVVASQSPYPPAFAEFADEIYEHVLDHPEGQEILDYAACALWFHRTEQHIPRGFTFPKVPELWDIEIPQSLIRWSEGVNVQRGIAWSEAYLSERHDRMSDRMCYAVIVGLNRDVLSNTEAE